MLAEFLRELVGHVRKAQQVEFYAPAQLPKTLFVRHEGELLEKTIAPPPRMHRLEGLDDIVNALKEESLGTLPEVFVSASGVKAYLDGSDRREVLTVPFIETKRFQLVRKLQTAVNMQPKDALKLLKIDLHGGNIAHVIQPLSRIEFTRTGTGRTNVEHGKESLGRSVEAMVQNAKDVPEQFALSVPVWSTDGFDRFGVQVAFSLYLDLEAQTVELRVLPDEVERCVNLALRAAVAELGSRLEGVPIFMGTP